MNKQLKTLKRTVALEGWTNRYGRRALREIAEAYKHMLQEMVEYAVEHKASQATLHKVFYRKFREKYPWLSTRVIKGCIRDAVRRAKSFRELKKKGIAKTDKPVVKRITLTYSDSQDWKLHDGVIVLKTHRGWIKIHYISHKQLHRYLYNGWKLSSELRLKLNGRKVIIYLTFTKNFEITYNPGNVVAVDINENNVTVAVFKDRKLREVYRVESGLGLYPYFPSLSNQFHAISNALSSFSISTSFGSLSLISLATSNINLTSPLVNGFCSSGNDMLSLSTSLVKKSLLFRK